MGEANRKRKLHSEEITTASSDEYFRGVIDLHMLPPVPEINGARILQLTMRLSKDHDGIIHWARDTESFQSIIKSFVRLDVETVSPPELPENWNPAITMMGANPQSE